jgi:tungstate transport system permease protein
MALPQLMNSLTDRVVAAAPRASLDADLLAIVGRSLAVSAAACLIALRARSGSGRLAWRGPVSGSRCGASFAQYVFWPCLRWSSGLVVYLLLSTGPLGFLGLVVFIRCSLTNTAGTGGYGSSC